MVVYLKKLEKKKRYGLVLGGGSARGFFHVGVLRRIEELGLDIAEISGTSMGAVVGSLIAIGKKYKEIYKVVEEIKYTSLIDVSLGNGIIKGNKLLKLLKEIFGDMKIGETKIPLRIVAVDINSGDKYVFGPEDTIVDAIRSSISIPRVFAPHKYKGRYFIDGGVVDNLPLDESSLHDVIVSSATKWALSPILKSRKKGISSLMPIKGVLNSKKILQRTFSIMIRQINYYSLTLLNKNILFMDFPDDTIEYYDFKKRKKIIDAGYESAKKVLVY